ncbi:MAG: hypothetical protein ACI4VH_06930 [Clostridia bacterium]
MPRLCKQGVAYEIQLSTVTEENVQNVGGCMRLESPTFKGTNECEYADEPINEIKKISGIQEVLNDK